MVEKKGWLGKNLTETEQECLDVFLVIHAQLTRSAVMTPQGFMRMMADIMAIITKLMSKKHGRPCSKDAVESELLTIVSRKG